MRPAHRRRGLPCGAWALALAAAVGCGERMGGGGTAMPRAAVSPEQPPLPAPERMPPGAAAEDFALTDASGAEFRSSSLKGKVWLASVFFANCPGPCFRENQAIADLLRQIPHEDFLAVSVTCDPDNDTPEALRRYGDRFQADPARWKFLTGDMDTIKKIANGTFLLPAEVGVHSERGVVFDRQGRMRGSYHLLQPDRVKLLEKLIRDVLAEPAEAPAPAPGNVSAE